MSFRQITHTKINKDYHHWMLSIPLVKRSRETHHQSISTTMFTVVHGSETKTREITSDMLHD